VQRASGVWISPDARNVDSNPGPEKTASDQELIAAINSGNEAAFETLYWRYRDWVVSLAFRFIGDPELAQDVMQETFLYVVKKFPGFRLTAQMKTFLYPAVRNLSIAARRQRDRYQPENPFAEHLETAWQMVEQPRFETEAWSQVLESLPAEQREVLLLRFVDGLSMSELAMALEIPVGTVKSRLHNALAKLRNDPATRKFFEE